jgi:hypothetical protein
LKSEFYLILLSFSLSISISYGFDEDSLSVAPTFSMKGGFYDSTIALELKAENQAKIYFTLDGRYPDEKDSLYSNPLQIDSTIAIRAIAYETGKPPSEVNTQTYFINESINLPFISLVTDSDHLFSDNTGIYVTGTNGIPGQCDQVVRNLNQDWERPVNIEFYEKNGTQGLNQQAGIKIFGGCSRTRFPQKSLALFARKIYGKGSFKYPLFKDRDIDKFESFVLRTSADDQVKTFFKDAFTAYSIKDNMDIDYMAYRPTAVFINGQYWGIHNMREKVNEHYINSHYDIEKEKINLLQGNAGEVYGINDGYNAMIEFLGNHNLGAPENYRALKKIIDINQFTDYFIANIHLAEVDWPGNNIKFWNSEDSKYDRWRWILFDRDQSYLNNRIKTNALALATAVVNVNWPNPPWATLLFRSLLANEDFKNRFLQTYAYHLSTTFVPERVNAILDDFKNGIAAEIPRHIERWGGQLDPDKSETWPIPTFNSVAEWEQNIEDVRLFLPAREPLAISHLSIAYNAKDRMNVSLSTNDLGQGNIFFYDKALKENRELSLFNNYPVSLKAIPQTGYHFSHWEIDGDTNKDAAITFTPNTAMKIKAHFEANTDTPKHLIINEINYNSTDKQNSGDWVEIYNPNAYPIDLGGYTVYDSNPENEFKFINGTFIDADGYLVLCESVNQFDSIYAEIENRISGMGFKFSNSNEGIKLFNADSILIDSVHYYDSAPWPKAADGKGYTLELISSDVDNALPESWRASNTKGSPGEFNLEQVLANSEEETQLFKLNQNYPNPVSFGQTKITYTLYEKAKVELRIFDAAGRETDRLINTTQEANSYELIYQTNHLNPGLYHLVMKVNEQFLEIRKMVLR